LSFPPQKKKKTTEKENRTPFVSEILFLRNPSPEDFPEKINSSNPQMEEALSQ
jgi:hypothetical protein